MAPNQSDIDFAHFFDYLVQARRRLLEWIAEAPADLYTRPFAFGLGSIRATLLHVADMEWAYVHRLNGRDYRKEDSPFTVQRLPTLPLLTTTWDAQRPETRRALAEIDDPSRSVEYVSHNFTPPQRTQTTAGGIAGQLLFNEVHHRAQVMTMLRLAGIAAQDLDYSRLVWTRTPVEA
jgi:uncharacterized damage-inducible protein DinB